MAQNQSPDLKRIATRGLENAGQLILQDLQALPEEAFDLNFGGATRTIPDIIYEINLTNEHVGMVIRGEEPFDWPDGWVKAPDDFRGKDLIIKAFETSIAKTVATAEGFTTQEIEEPIELEGKQTTRFQRCQFMTLHMWYHSGQLNFIQTMLGDDGWHWK